MDIEHIGLFVVGWFAVGFILALGLGKILREANNLERLDTVGRAVTRGSAGAAAQSPKRDGPIENKDTYPTESSTVRPT